MNDEVAAIIARLGLEPLPQEGGFFRQIELSKERLPNGRAARSVIWFLLTPEGFSALHRLQTPETWCFSEGDAVEHVQLDPRDGRVRVTRLAVKGDAVTVPGGVWQGAQLAEVERGWARVQCTMEPAWAEEEFELGERNSLAREFPAAAARIAALTR
ncbi:MAG: cupin domain-containing protein [Verrucomicrobia bacterium]|nr:cupin domain-containing protein [Verrucomicrobiota bacterium]